MKKVDYINQYLKKYQKKLSENQLLKESLFMERLLQKTKKFSFSTISFSSFRYISKEYTIILMKQFLQEISCDYLSFFENLLKQKCIIWQKSGPVIHKAFYQKEKPYIEITLRNTLQDFIVLVHEFFHLTNRKFEEVNYPNTREDLSEFISIYFEKRALIFLENQNYNKQELLFIRFCRFQDTYLTIKHYHFENTIWKAFQKNKGITLENSPYPFEKIVSYIERYGFSPFTKKNYILGDLLSEYVLLQETSISKILEVNESLSEYSLFMILESLGIALDFTKAEEIFSNYQKHFLEIISTFRQEL